MQALCQTLSHYQETDQAVNGFVIADLLDLKATEAAELIERAYAADCVDVSLNGNWNDARKKLGVEGLGLVSEELASMEWGWAPRAQANREDAGAPLHGGRRKLPSDHAADLAVPVGSSPKVGRNEPCPCGSGKKYKKCCGR